MSNPHLPATPAPATTASPAAGNGLAGRSAPARAAGLRPPALPAVTRLVLALAVILPMAGVARGQTVPGGALVGAAEAEALPPAASSGKPAAGGSLPANPASATALVTDSSAPPAPADAGAKRGNPLWSVPLRTLSATRERPLFTPGRRPPEPPPEAAPPPPPPPPAPPAEAAAPQPQLSLIGTIVDLRGGYAVFVETATGATIRLRTGESHDGWVLRSVSMRDAMLQKDRGTVVLSLPPREIDLAPSGRAPGAGPQPHAPAPARPAAPAPPQPIFYPEH